MDDDITLYHCVTQLQEDSWEFRVKRPTDVPNCDDMLRLEEVNDTLAKFTEIARSLRIGATFVGGDEGRAMFRSAARVDEVVKEFNARIEAGRKVA